MEYINLTNLNNELSSGKFLLDGNVYKNEEVILNIKEKETVSILFSNISNNLKIHFDIKDNANVKLSFLQTCSADFDFVGDVHSSATVTIYFADFVKGNIKVTTNINLIGEGANCYWNLASLAKDDEKKEFDISVYQKSLRSFCEINNYGVARDKSRLLFSGICKIEKGSHGSVAHQNSKIMVFDEESDAIAKPILKIDDNDIEASHAAVVGKISDEHMFYLTSRGLSEVEARELITYGYLKPIINGFDDEELSRQINYLIEGSL